MRRKNGIHIDYRGYILIRDPNHPRARSNGYVYKHIIDAEKALGKKLPQKCEVHHHTKDQLIICPDRAYHCLIHLRTRALKESNHPNYRQCYHCREWDDPENLYISPRNIVWHRRCSNKYRKKRRRIKKGDN